MMDSPSPIGRTSDGIRLVCISDTHGRHRELPTLPFGDILIHAGDFTNIGEREQIDDFVLWMEHQPHTHKIIISGNHDITMHTDYYNSHGRERFHRRFSYDSLECRKLLESSTGIIYLEDGETTIEGIKMWGSPWQPEFCDWAFNLDRGIPLREKWALIPDDSDIVITHGPVKGFVDACHDRFLAGCEELAVALTTRVKPRLHVSGHIHEAYGAVSNGTTLFVNASTCTLQYRPTNPPIVVFLPYDRTKPAQVESSELRPTEVVSSEPRATEVVSSELRATEVVSSEPGAPHHLDDEGDAQSEG